MKFLRAVFATAALLCVLALPARAQFLGYTSPQTVTFIAFNNTACSGVAQTAIAPNLGQPQHYLSVKIASGSPSKLKAEIDGIDANGNVFIISDTGEQPQTTPISGMLLSASGYFPQIQISVTCSTGSNFTATYSGTSSTTNVNSGSYLNSQLDKLQLFSGVTASFSDTVRTPFGNSLGLIFFNGNVAANSTLNVLCQGFSNIALLNMTIPLTSGSANAQAFPVPASPCTQLLTTFTAGSGTPTVTIEYAFYEPGLNHSTTAFNLSSPFNAASLAEKGPRWQVTSTPAVSTQASASKAQGASGVRHIADCVIFSAGSTTAPALTKLNINLRDGTSGVGTILQSWTVVIPATTGQNVAPFSICGLNQVGSLVTAMTLEFSALLTNLFEDVTLTGYDVQ